VLSARWLLDAVLGFDWLLLTHFSTSKCSDRKRDDKWGATASFCQFLSFLKSRLFFINFGIPFVGDHFCSCHWFSGVSLKSFWRFLDFYWLAEFLFVSIFISFFFEGRMAPG
jgi:hypothetical protein